MCISGYPCVRICACVCACSCGSMFLCVWEIPHFKHMLETAGPVSLTSPSNVSLQSQPRTRLDDCSLRDGPEPQTVLTAAGLLSHRCFSRLYLCTRHREANWNGPQMLSHSDHTHTHTHMHCTHTHMHCTHTHPCTHAHTQLRQLWVVFFPLFYPPPFEKFGVFPFIHLTFSSQTKRL